MMGRLLHAKSSPEIPNKEYITRNFSIFCPCLRRKAKLI
jgi:hypothetical protein